MSTIIAAVVSVTAIGVFCAVMLTVASKVMAVETDERTALIRECLPGVNCGACGFSGCDWYAVSLAADLGVKTNLCIPGGTETAKQISAILDAAFEDVAERVAVIHCGGTCDSRKYKMDYDGIQSCRAARQLFGGQSACGAGCLGFGDCADVCRSGAVCVENGLARIDKRKCTGCGLCAKACPSGIISIEYDSVKAAVMCMNTEKGAVARKKCTSACIACRKCEKECPVNAIKVADNLAVIDYTLCTGCGECAKVCVSHCIAYSGGA